MRTKSTGGFTLIELLIVIAIIGILAAVLIPNLMNARTTAGQRAAQAHSSTLYTAAMAALADDPRAVVGDISIANCGNGGAILVGGQPSSYSANPAPANTTCSLGANTAGTDIRAEVIFAGGTANARTYVNGVDVTEGTGTGPGTGGEEEGG